MEQRQPITPVRMDINQIFCAMVEVLYRYVAHVGRKGWFESFFISLISTRWNFPSSFLVDALFRSFVERERVLEIFVIRE